MDFLEKDNFHYDSFETCFQHRHSIINKLHMNIILHSMERRKKLATHFIFEGQIDVLSKI
jgi:hypothetical protein